ncbi:MAG: carbonic anhydrase [Bacteroidales bacterium]|nr:carbonic anhydrase [Lentimicrobiaceae bacterium]MDD5695322.1 carbonic anhydrase [Bacteroidales bacterium]
MTIHQQLLERILNDNDQYVRAHDLDYFLGHSRGQTPQVTMLTCSDSRVSSQIIVQDPVNRVFVIKNIGNQVATCEGSLDYGIYHLKTPLLLIVGHTDCGAIKARMKGVRGEPRTIRNELLSLPACQAKSLQNIDYDQLVRENILNNIRYQVKIASEKYQDLIQRDELWVVGAYYDFRNDLGKGWGRVVVVWPLPNPSPFGAGL